MPIYTIEQQDEFAAWRGRVRITSEPGDELDQAGISELLVKLADAHNGGRQAKFLEAGEADDDYSGVSIVVSPPRVSTELELQAQVALDAYLKWRREQSK